MRGFGHSLFITHINLNLVQNFGYDTCIELSFNQPKKREFWKARLNSSKQLYTLMLLCKVCDPSTPTNKKDGKKEKGCETQTQQPR